MIVLLITLLTTMNVNADAPHGHFKDKKIKLSISISDAFYLDADGDGEEDDVKAFFDLYATSDKRKVDFKIQFDIELILESGYTFKHKFKRDIESNNQTVDISYELTLYNHAIEPGFYDLYINIKTKDGMKIKGEVWKTFDPPGGTGGDPYAILL